MHYRFNQKDSTSISTDYILSIFEDSGGTLWIGGWGGGLNRFDKQNQKFMRYTHDPEDPHSICDDIVNSIHESESNGQSVLWIGTSGGLSYMNLQDSISGYFHHIFEQDGLPNQHIYGILEDGKKNLWMSTNNGLTKFSPSGKFRNYDAGDGLPINEFSGGAYYKSKEGRLYFGCPAGFITFHPDSMVDNRFIPPVAITAFKKFNINYYPGRDISILKELELSHKDYVFSFTFSALDYSAPAKNRYAYKMEGFNKDWIFTDSENRTATFTNMDPGKYVFRVKGSNSDGVWNESGAAIRIIITPPYWQTWWFRGLISLIILLIFITLHNYRVKHLKSQKKAQEQVSAKLIDFQEQERKRIASELHDSLGQNLLIINNVVQRMSLRHDDLTDEFSPLSQTIQDTINEVREISHHLHPHVLDRLGLKKAIESAINKAAGASDVTFHTTMEDVNRLLPPSSEIHLFRIIQEAINNILKHSDARNATIDLRKTEHEIHLLVRDDGKGFEIREIKKEGTLSSGMGISDMEERARLLKGKLNIVSRISRGTTVKLIIPY
jgi:signal transduction histidine kinase